ncbi:MAG: hypothetical protein LPD71_00855 [Shewanella sp.]|nr:hypothetical protein [Shewanella sp.]MCF1437343.1 hypothetical protein [Shewanella sp.]MCF1457500.1 hypothetical protein [Shewanella sp.]
MQRRDAGVAGCGQHGWLHFVIEGGLMKVVIETIYGNDLKDSDQDENVRKTKTKNKLHGKQTTTIGLD